MESSDAEVRRLAAEVERLRGQRDAALAEVRKLSAVNDREWIDYLAVVDRVTRAEAQVRAIEALCAPPGSYVLVLAIKAALATATRRSGLDRALPEAG
jgi:hypothetical protein